MIIYSCLLAWILLLMYEEMASTRQSDQIGGGNIIEKAVLESKDERKLILA